MDLSAKAGPRARKRAVLVCTLPTFAGSILIHISMEIVDRCSYVYIAIDRSLELDYTQTIENYGVTSYRYAGTSRTFANTTENPDNWCFATGGQQNPSGIFNSSTCRFGAPVFVSFPHFYLADPCYGEQVVGLEPRQDLHEFHIDLEPVRCQLIDSKSQQK